MITSSQLQIFWPIIIPVGVFILLFIFIAKKVKNHVIFIPKVIIPYSDIPDDLTPIEVGYMINDHVRKRDVSAEIIYLAEKGYLKIKKLGRKRIELLQYVEHDYEFTLLKETGTLSNFFDKEIMELIFGSSNAEVGKVVNLASSMIVRYRGIGASIVLDSTPTNNLSKKDFLFKEHILGFKNYIQDKNNKIDILGKFLPYAIMLGVDANLIKESVGATTPNWYEGDNSDFTSEILLFNSIVSKAVY